MPTLKYLLAQVPLRSGGRTGIAILVTLFNPGGSNKTFEIIARDGSLGPEVGDCFTLRSIFMRRMCIRLSFIGFPSVIGSDIGS